MKSRMKYPLAFGVLIAIVVCTMRRVPAVAGAASSNGVIRVVPVGSAPDAVAVDTRVNHVFVVNSGENSVSVLNATSGLPVRTVALGKPVAGLNTAAYSAATDELTGRAFIVKHVTPPSPSTAYVLDAQTGRIVRVVRVGVFSAAVAIDPATDRVFVANLDSNNVTVLDGRTGAPLRTVPVGQGPSNLTVVERTDRVLVANSDGTVSVLDARTGRLVRSIRTNPTPTGAAGIASGSFGRVFEWNQQGKVSVLDPSTGRLVRTLNVAEFPGSAAFDAATGRLYLTISGINANGHAVVVLNARTGHLVRRILAGRGPVSAVVDSSARRIFVVNYGDHTVRVLNADTEALIRTITTVNPFDVALNAATHRAFVVNFNFAHRRGSVMVLNTTV